jgi:hypothetical protein
MINISFLLYTAFRLAPFILVSYFSLSSILNQDVKGIVYLAGLLFACFVASIVGSLETFRLKTENMNKDNEMICNVLTLTDTGRFSNIPLSMVTFTYTFFFLVYIIADKKLAVQNIPTLIIFPLIIIGEFAWNSFYGCASMVGVICAGIIGGLIGVMWSMIIAKNGAVKLQYFNGITNSNVCTRSSTQKFKCTTQEI